MDKETGQLLLRHNRCSHAVLAHQLQYSFALDHRTTYQLILVSLKNKGSGTVAFLLHGEYPVYCR
jgi:hypothetical protein